MVVGWGVCLDEEDDAVGTEMRRRCGRKPLNGEDVVVWYVACSRDCDIWSTAAVYEECF